ncbi:DUF2249 domain-containing protein [Devosia rhodophyticola]|uniref:DUF2249 domain-containing protein n=1 Tax=Devosia rhodophyticola TaxID=3026423 RepID=A0ABY7Z018_9HYPH|nr:DUF2249 domain-containing protein [Devosia rhodophyticola]WDR06489.1 DUF2249 domain-containing protein [Devosia rhodophyticola]
MNDLELDIRPLLRSGGEPFGAIMGAVNQLENGQRLKLLATFKPEPLLPVMANKGFTSEATELEDGCWVVLFTPTAGICPTDVTSNAQAPQTWPDPVQYLDCSELDPAESIARILEALKALPQGEVLFVLLGGEPVVLYPELHRCGHEWAGNFDETGEAFRLMIRVGTL